MMESPNNINSVLDLLLTAWFLKFSSSSMVVPAENVAHPMCRSLKER